MSGEENRAPARGSGLADAPGGGRAFAGIAALALALHALLLFPLHGPGLQGGADLVPHLALIEQFQREPGIHNPYPPLYHALGALLEPRIGIDLYTRIFALGAAALLIAAFRIFQRAAGLPWTSTALFVLTPYVLSFSYCLPKVEAVGFSLILLGLAQLLRGRHALCAIALAATFYVHVASALLFGLAGGVLSLARRDARGLAALAAGSLGCLPLLASHLVAGCNLSEAFLFSRGGYSLPVQNLWPQDPGWTLALANPLALGAALLGAPSAWRRNRPVAILGGAFAVLYLNNLWLAPFGVATLVNWTRGLTVLSIAVAIGAGCWAAQRPARAAALVGLTVAWAVAAPFWLVPGSCYVQAIEADEYRSVRVRRCAFRWTRSPERLGPQPPRGSAEAPVDVR